MVPFLYSGIYTVWYFRDVLGVEEKTMVDSGFGNSSMFEALESLKDQIVYEDVQDNEKVDYQNNAYNITSIFGYLIGVWEEEFLKEDNPAMMKSVYKKLEMNKNARIIRNLCMVRTAMEKHYMAIVDTFRNSIANINSIPDYIPTKIMYQLDEDGIRLVKSHHDIDQYIIAVNKEISNKIANVKSVFPEWIKWEYLKELFIMPNGYTKEGIKEEGNFYNSNRNRYPYQVYMNWCVEDAGNILYCDEKFVKLLYESHEDYFFDNSLVRNAGDLTVGNINDFLEEAKTAVFVVDCENSNPVKLASVLGGLTAEQKEHIKEVLLFDSHYTAEGWAMMAEDEDNKKTINVDENLFDWDSLEISAGIKMEHIVVDRLLESKSQVDMTLAVRTTQEVYKNNVDSVVLVSSDSDYWAMIKNLPDVKFMMMLEREKTSPKTKESLDSKGIKHCFLDDFYTGVSYSIKTDTLKKYIQTFFDNNYSFNANSLIDNAVHNSWIEMTMKEKESFLDKYIRKAHIEIDMDGIFRIVLGEK